VARKTPQYYCGEVAEEKQEETAILGWSPEEAFTPSRGKKERKEQEPPHERGQERGIEKGLQKISEERNASTIGANTSKGRGWCKSNNSEPPG